MVKDLKTEIKENNIDDLLQNKFDFEQFDAVYVDSFDQYQQKDYYKILNSQHEKHIKLWAWKNDKANAEFAILCADIDLQNVSVVASDLHFQSSVIDACNIKLSFIKDVKAYTGHAGWYANNPANIMPKGQRELFPEVIYSDSPVSIGKNSFQLVWLEVSTPKDIMAGVYNGKITITAQNVDTSVMLDYELEVIDATMPDTQDYLFDVEYWSHPYNVAYYYDVKPFSDEHISILKEHMSLYKSLGGHAITASIVEEAWGGQTYGGENKVHYPSMIKWIKSCEGKWLFDYTNFDKWVQLNKEIGIADKIICYSMMPWGNIIKYYDDSRHKICKLKAKPAIASKYSEIWMPFLTDFVKHIDEKGWFDSIYIGFDERHNMGTALDLIEKIKNKDGKTLKISAAFNDFKHNASIFNRLDYASVGLQQIRNNLQDFKEQVAIRRTNNQKTTMYTATEHVPNSFTKSIPVESYWSAIFAGSLNATGFLRWAFDAWVKNPLEESTHWSFPAGDCFLVYPSLKDDIKRESKFTLRLAKLDEGVRDVNKLYLMKNVGVEFEKKVEDLFSQIKGKEENHYEFYTMSKTNFWGRKAKWLTENGKQSMLSDMKKIKEKIFELSKEYSKILK